MLDFRRSLAGRGQVVATDNWSVAPALFLADKMYMVPKIKDPTYMQTVLDICRKEDIKAVTSFIDPEIEVQGLEGLLEASLVDVPFTVDYYVLESVKSHPAVHRSRVEIEE